ncbi:hypothetical protein [Labedaea rhizosphaerae]|uniref:hypothetical protein n=1 Tax=Labedaea rhizosphaerae TaxID=598644 RepID=UPI00105F04C6|nr:hypothetical protein [Labedaea rhizosphaerae]
MLREPRRLLLLGWLVGLLMAGAARSAAAEGFVVGPDLAHGQPRTLFETYDYSDYQLTVKPDDEASGFMNIGKVVFEVIGFLNNVIAWICLGLLFGALTLLEWLLNLTVYRDSAGQIDVATQLIASHVFWPLIAATVAVGAFVTYARWRGDGRGFVSDLGWVVAAGALAVGFATGPSQVMDSVDSLRTDLATGMTSGAADYVATQGSPTGFAEPPIGGSGQETSTRRLTDGLWNTFGATTWCFAEFHDLDICKVAGYHALAQDETWQKWMGVFDDQGSVPEFKQYGDWIRGQDLGRTAYLLMLAVITVPMGFLLLRLVIAGLMAAVGFLLMLILCLLFLTFWAIPGWLRQVGIRYLIYTLGMEGQALFITALLAGVLDVSAILATLAGKYGFLVIACLNAALLAAAVRARAWLDMITTVPGAAGMGYLGAAMTVGAVRATGRAAGALVGAATGTARSGLTAVGRGVANAGLVTTSGGLSPRLAGARWRRVALAEPSPGRPLQVKSTRLDTIQQGGHTGSSPSPGGRPATPSGPPPSGGPGNGPSGAGGGSATQRSDGAASGPQSSSRSAEGKAPGGTTPSPTSKPDAGPPAAEPKLGKQQPPRGQGSLPHQSGLADFDDSSEGEDPR